MSYEVIIKNIADSGDGISVEAEINGERIAHTAPKNMGFLEEDPKTGRPRIVDKLAEKYRKRKKCERAMTQEESIIEESDLEGRGYRIGRESTLNNEYNQEDDIGDTVDLDKPDTIRKYLKDNMAEGYLSDDEESKIDEFVDKYTEMMSDSGEDYSDKEALQKLLRKVYEGKVQ